MSDPIVLSQLRHAYEQLVNGYVSDHRAFADGLIAPLIRRLEADPAAEIERLRGENEVTAADLHAWMKLKAAAEARLAEAVEWVREARKFCQDGLAGDGCTPQQALERIHEASGDILAKEVQS